MAFSKTIVTGRLTADPKVREINGGKKVANFSVAVDRTYNDQTDFFDVVAWNRQAELVEKYLGKGRKVLLEGRMEGRSYTAKTPSGEDYERRVWELVTDKVEFLDSGQQNQQGQQNFQQSQQTYQAQDIPPEPQYTGFDDDDAPF